MCEICLGMVATVRKAGGVVVKLLVHITVCSPELSFRKAYLGAWDVTKVIVLFTKRRTPLFAQGKPLLAPVCCLQY